jgi:hypothetical protein
MVSSQNPRKIVIFKTLKTIPIYDTSYRFWGVGGDRLMALENGYFQP